MPAFRDDVTRDKANPDSREKLPLRFAESLQLSHSHASVPGQEFLESTCLTCPAAIQFLFQSLTPLDVLQKNKFAPVDCQGEKRIRGLD